MMLIEKHFDSVRGMGVYACMTSFNEYLSGGNAWLFIPGAILLGALHGLEPGHSKTMMAAFIVSIRGTITQAILLGVSATVSHTAIIWLLAYIGLRYGGQWNAETTEPYFQIASGVIIFGLAGWMFWRTRRQQSAAAAHSHSTHEHGPHGGTWIDTGHGLIEISVFETNVPPHFRLFFFDDEKKEIAPSAKQTVTIETIRPDGAKQVFNFVSEENYLKSTSDIPEPHEFSLTLSLAHGDHAHTYQTKFTEDHHHDHGHEGLDESSIDFQDAHERAHAAELQKRFANRDVTTPQIILFGLTGGLLPCPAAFSILLICLQLKKFTLGFTLVLAFSLGLAITLVLAGSLAAISVQHASKRFAGFGKLAMKMPYISSTVMVVIGMIVALQGFKHLAH